jgi:hypothetical protein
MYLRYTTIRKNGKVHKYWRLVRSVRRGSKVRQETVAQLGELDAEGRVAARELAQSFGGVDRQRRLFEEEPDAALVQVDVGKLRLERNRRFGDVWVAWKVWQALGLDEWLAKRMPRGWCPFGKPVILSLPAGIRGAGGIGQGAGRGEAWVSAIGRRRGRNCCPSENDWGSTAGAP